MKKLLKVIEEYRVDSEEEVKIEIENLKENAKEEGYFLKSAGYTYKDKKSQGEIIDFGYLLKVVKVYEDFF